MRKSFRLYIIQKIYEVVAGLKFAKMNLSSFKFTKEIEDILKYESKVLTVLADESTLDKLNRVFKGAIKDCAGVMLTPNPILGKDFHIVVIFPDVEKDVESVYIHELTHVKQVYDGITADISYDVNRLENEYRYFAPEWLTNHKEIEARKNQYEFEDMNNLRKSIRI
ncbi:MAG: hypothetical protein ACRCX2_17950 [Paraclostridium sp.]